MSKRAQWVMERQGPSQLYLYDYYVIGLEDNSEIVAERIYIPASVSGASELASKILDLLRRDQTLDDG